MNARSFFSVVALSALLVTGCADSAQDDAPITESTSETQEVHIVIDAKQQILMDNEVIILKDLRREILAELGEGQAEFVITATPKTPMGLISDVRQQIPPANASGIRYPLPQG